MGEQGLQQGVPAKAVGETEGAYNGETCRVLKQEGNAHEFAKDIAQLKSRFESAHDEKMGAKRT